MIVYQDEVHFQVTTSVTRKWVVKGSKPKVKSAPSRKSVSYSGYIVPETPEYQDIRDKMTLIFLPPYSPDLNPTEQVWRITRREATHNSYFANAQVLEDTLDPYFAAFRRPNEKLASLCAFKGKS